MRKIFAFLTATICLLTAVVTYAANSAPSPDAKTVGVVVIGGLSFKNDDVYKSLTKDFNPEKNSKLVIEAGEVAQSKYMDFWARKGFLYELPPTEETMIEFAAASGYDRVVYLVAGDFETKKEFEQYDNPLGNIFPQTNTFDVYYHTTGKVFGFVCDKSQLLNKAEQTADSKYGIDSVFRICAAKLAKIFSDNF